ncbi:MAG TPA: carboxymuconolactone decarboxylase family protein [Streptosporangiaceae bacterium]|nr:carboxymuconolactone decarboxylase family protein [Streptosporangiaceae bacterium]
MNTAELQKGRPVMSTPGTTDLGNLTSRLPDPNLFIPEFTEIAGAMYKATANGTIPPTTISLVQLRAGQIIGNTYHTVRQTGDLRKAGQTEERITAVASWRDAPYFTDAERVALELVEAVLTPNASAERVSDELCARAAAHYDHKALWTLTVAIGQMCFFIPVALIGKPIPGKEPHWSK